MLDCSVTSACFPPCTRATCTGSAPHSSAQCSTARVSVVSTAQALAGTDPTSLHLARAHPAAQRAFWLRYVSGHILDGDPRLNFLAQGGAGAVVANVLPAQEVRPPNISTLAARDAAPAFPARCHGQCSSVQMDLTHCKTLNRGTFGNYCF
jgi:hypothetical protein